MIKELEEKIKEYFELKQASDELKEKLDTLNAEIKDVLIKGNIKKETTTNGYLVNLIEKKSIKYSDEVAIKSYLKEHSMSDYIIEAIDSTRLNKAIKESEMLSKDLKSNLVENISYNLSVTESK